MSLTMNFPTSTTKKRSPQTEGPPSKTQERSLQTKMTMTTIFKEEAATSNPNWTFQNPPGPQLKDHRESGPIRGQLKAQSSRSCNRSLEYYQESNPSSVSCNRCPKSHLKGGHNNSQNRVCLARRKLWSPSVACHLRGAVKRGRTPTPIPLSDLTPSVWDQLFTIKTLKESQCTWCSGMHPIAPP